MLRSPFSPLFTRFHELVDRLGHHSAELGCRVHRGGDRAVRAYYELAGLDNLGAPAFTDPCSQFLSDLNRNAVSNREREVMVGVSFGRVGVTVGIASDDLDTKLVEPLEPLFCVG